VNTNEKIHPRSSETISAPQGERKYILEGVFWVPISNCSSRHSTSLVLPELHSKKFDTVEVSSSDETELDRADNLR